MKTVIIAFKCPVWLYSLLSISAIALLGLVGIFDLMGWPLWIKWCILATVAAFAAYALLLVPSEFIVTDSDISQKTAFSKQTLRWKDIAEWQYATGPQGDYLWIKDVSGTMHYPKRWLVYGERMAKLVTILQERGVRGETRKI